MGGKGGWKGAHLRTLRCCFSWRCSPASAGVCVCASPRASTMCSISRISLHSPLHAGWRMRCRTRAPCSQASSSSVVMDSWHASRPRMHMPDHIRRQVGEEECHMTEKPKMATSIMSCAGRHMHTPKNGHNKVGPALCRQKRRGRGAEVWYALC